MSEEITNNEEEIVPSPYEGLVDQIHDVDLDEIPLLVVKNGKKTLLRLGLNIEGKIENYLKENGILKDLEDLKEQMEELEKLKEQLDELKEKLEELEENGVGGSTGDSDSYGKRKLADCTWAEIKEIADSGMASEVFELGDTKDINTGYGVRTIRIEDFNNGRFIYDSGNTCNIVFGATQLGYKTYPRTTPHASTDTFSQELALIYDGLDEDLKAVISWTITQRSNSEQNVRAKTFGFESGDIYGSGANVLAIYKTGASLIKSSNNGNGNPQPYWTVGGYDAYTRLVYWYVTSTGEIINNISIDPVECYEAFGFCL